MCSRSFGQLTIVQQHHHTGVPISKGEDVDRHRRGLPKSRLFCRVTVESALPMNSRACKQNVPGFRLPCFVALFFSKTHLAISQLSFASCRQRRRCTIVLMYGTCRPSIFLALFSRALRNAGSQPLRLTRQKDGLLALSAMMPGRLRLRRDQPSVDPSICRSLVICAHVAAFPSVQPATPCMRITDLL